MTKKQIEKKYDCNVHLDWVDGFRFYTAFSNKDNEEGLFESASGWNLSELQENIEENLYETVNRIAIR